MDLVWLVCLRPMGCHLLNFFEISGRGFRSSAAKLRPKGNIGKLQRRPVFVSAFDAPVRRCAGKTSFFASFLAPLVEVCPKLHFVGGHKRGAPEIRLRSNDDTSGESGDAILAESCRIFGPISTRGPSRWCSQGAPPGRHSGGSDHHLWFLTCIDKTLCD